MRRLITSFLCATLLLAGGCAPATVKDLEQTGLHRHAIVEVPYQQAYKNVHDRMHECMRFGWISGPAYKIDSQLYTDLHEGDINLIGNQGRGLSSGYLASIKIKRKDDSSAQIDIWTMKQGKWPQWGDRFIAWARGSTTSCN